MRGLSLLSGPLLVGYWSLCFDLYAIEERLSRSGPQCGVIGAAEVVAIVCWLQGVLQMCDEKWEEVEAKGEVSKW